MHAWCCAPLLRDLRGIYQNAPAGLADFAVVQSYLSTATKWGSPDGKPSTSSSAPDSGSHPPSHQPRG
ncbi:hypothetical protein Kisp02_22760 [Kineosporia sp. NBRC 101731]|nr:hypothetical protein Kisp02_22760 [Kineosporia sp. NBRC 101731]